MKFIFILILFPIQLLAQDITGVWVGNLYNDTTKQYIPYELAISNHNNKLRGYSYTTYIIDNIKNIGVKSVKVIHKREDFFVEDEKLIYNNYNEPPAKGVRTFSKLTFSENDSTEFLKGMWNTNPTREYSALTGTIFLQKKKKIWETLIVKKLDEMGLSNNLSFLPVPVSPTDLVKVTPSDKPPIAANEKKALEKNSLAETKIEKAEEPQLPSVNEISRDETKVVTINENNKPISSSDPNIEKLKTKPGIKSPVKEIEIRKTEETSSVALVTNNEKVNKGETLIDNNRSNPTFKPEVEEIKATQTNTNPVKETENIQKEEKPYVALEKNSLKENKAEAPFENNKIKTESITVKTEETPNDLAETKVEELKKINQENKPVSKTENNISLSKEETIKSPSLATTPLKGVKKIVAPASPPAADIASRKIETIQSVEITQDSLVLSLFDNGVVDGDTVSVLLNGKVIWPRVGLLERATNKTIYLSPEMGDSILVVMYAENLGSIPPNTGLLVVREGGIDHEIRFTGDLKKNSAIILIRKRKIK